MQLCPTLLLGRNSSYIFQTILVNTPGKNLKKDKRKTPHYRQIVTPTRVDGMQKADTPDGKKTEEACINSDSSLENWPKVG